MQKQIASTLPCLQADNTQDENNSHGKNVTPLNFSTMYTFLLGGMVDWLNPPLPVFSGCNDLPEGERAACKSVEQSHPCGRRYRFRFTPEVGLWRETNIKHVE